MGDASHLHHLQELGELAPRVMILGDLAPSLALALGRVGPVLLVGSTVELGMKSKA